MITLENTKTMYDLVQNAAREYKNKIYLRYEENEVIYEKSYEEFAKECNAISAWIEEQSKLYGHKIHVALLGKNSSSYLAVLFGVIAAGSVAIPLDVQLNDERLEDCLQRSDVDIVFYDWDYNSQMDVMKAKCENIKEYICLQHGKHIKSAKDVINGYLENDFISKATAEDCALILFTSGTTGRGKGVMLSHGNLIDNTFCSDEDPETGKIALNVLPIHHVFCLNSDIFISMRYGNTICINNSLSKMLYYIKLFQPTVIRLVPMMAKVLYNKIAMTAEKYPEMSMEEVKESVLGKNIRRIISGGGYLSETVARNFLNLNISIGQGYGMTECSPKISVPEYDRLDKLASVGKIVDRCKVRVVDGEIQVKSPSVMMGYYKEPDKTAESITEDGWLRTGDLGYVDEENFLYLTGRQKNLIVLSNGENVSPEAVENEFDNERLISDILVYGLEDSIAAEVYPNYEYATLQGIKEIEKEVQKIINDHNKSLPSFMKIVKCKVRKEPFEKTSSKKIIRQKYFEEKKEEIKKEDSLLKPVNEMQQEIYDSIAGVLGHKIFGIDSDLYQCGLDSLGSIMLIEELHEKFQKTMTFNDLMENATVLKIEQFLNGQKEEAKKVDLSVRKVYPLTGMQKYFAYIIKGNTTSNLPFTFKLDDSIDLERLKEAIEGTIDAHPGLKAIIKFDENQYKVFRDDERKVDIPIISITEEEWKSRLKELLVPFKYTEDDSLFHIYIFQTEKNKYLFFDVAHIMGDGITMNILFEDVNKLYCGKPIEKESYTFYEFILEEEMRNEMGIRKKNTEYFDDLMKNIKMKRSILNKKEKEDYFSGENAVIRKRFSKVIREKIVGFCKKNGVSENAYFLTAYNYCISLFSDEKDIFCTSIHSGRTDNRWSRIAGPLFLTYYFRFTQVPHERVTQLLKKSSKQIMNTMRCYVPTPREGEMFFQFQGDILNINKIGDAKAEIIRLQLDSIPFHMQVMYDDEGYYMELRYWKNRFDRKQIEIFLNCYESLLVAMMDESSVRRLKKHLPEEVYPKHYYIPADDLNREAGYEMVSNLRGDEKVKVYILDEEYNKKPYGAWGPLYIMNYQPDYYDDKIDNPYGEGILYGTNKIARILPDGTLDFLENGGRTVLTDGIHGRRYYDLSKLEKTLCQYDGIDYAEGYLCYNPEINEMSLITDIKGSKYPDMEKLKKFIAERCPKNLIPTSINYIGNN